MIYNIETNSKLENKIYIKKQSNPNIQCKSIVKFVSGKAPNVISIINKKLKKSNLLKLKRSLIRLQSKTNTILKWKKRTSQITNDSNST